MWKRLLLAGSVVGLMAILAAGAHADDGAAGDKSIERQLGTDHYVAGATLTVSEAVAGDLIAAGGNVDIDAPVAGDAVVAGGHVRIGGDIAQSVYAAGGEVKIGGKVGRNVRVAGGQVDITPKAQIAGNLTVGGGQVNLKGSVTGHVLVGGGRVFIDAAVGGDVDAASAQVELGPHARIAGKLRYGSAKELQRDPQAQVLGGVEQQEESVADRERRHGERRFIPGGASVAWMLGTMLLAVVLLAALPRFYDQVAQTLRARPGTSLLLGFVLLVCVPAAALILMITIIGIPLALVTIALYLALLPVGYASAGIALGAWALQRFKSDRASQRGWRIASALLAVLLLALLGRIPAVGAIVGFASLVAGLGALLLQVRRAPSGV